MTDADRRLRHERGFTLLELMITITVMAVLLAIAVPSFRGTIQRNRLSSANNDLLASFTYARAAAIERSQIVSICPSPDGSTCTSSGQAYDPGWLIYTYPAGAASANMAYATSSATLLRVLGPRTGVSIHALQTPVITFGQQGQLIPGTAIAFLLCARPATDGIAASTAKVPGIRMDVNGSGSVSTTPIPPGGGCTS